MPIERHEYSEVFSQVNGLERVSPMHRNRWRAGVSLVEVMVAACVLMIVFMGHSKYRDYATLDARRVAMQNSAARVALRFCESWQAAGGIDTFDPASHLDSCLAVAECSAGDRQSFPVPESFTLASVYAVTLDGDTYYAGLSWKQVNDALRALDITVLWALRQPREPGVRGADKSYKLTAYAVSANGWQ